MAFQWFLLYVLILLGAFFFTCHWFGQVCTDGKYAFLWFWSLNIAFICFMIVFKAAGG